MPVRPSDAASLVLIRNRAAHAEVLMGKRARRHRFLPDVYVFPGGRVERGVVDARDREICRLLAPRLTADGLYFVGLDIIGGFVTEVNVTSPTGIQEINRLDGVRLETKVVDFIERRTATLDRPAR